MAKGKNPEQDCPPVSAGEAIVAEIQGIVGPVVEANAKADKAADKAAKAREAADQAGANAIAGFESLSADINSGMARAAEILQGAVRSDDAEDQAQGSTNPEDSVQGNTEPQPVVINNENTQINNNPEDGSANRRDGRFWRRAAAVGAVVVALGAAAYFINKDSGNNKVAANTPAKTDDLNKISANDTICEDTWAETKADNDNNRVDGNGQESLGDAKTTEEARAAANEWLQDRQDENPVVLAGMAKSMFNVEIDPDKYYDNNGCATPYAVEKVAEMQGAIAVMKVSTKDPSANSVNSGVSGGRFNQSGSRGISGDRSGITLVNKKTGEKIGLMERCANPTFEGNPGLPEGKTDNPHEDTPGVTPKKDKNDTPAGVPGQNHGDPEGPESSRPKPGSAPDDKRQPQKPKPTPLPTPEDTRDDATGTKPPAEEGNIPPVTQPPVNDNGSADKPKTEDPGGF